MRLSIAAVGSAHHLSPAHGRNAQSRQTVGQNGVILAARDVGSTQGAAQEPEGQDGPHRSSSFYSRVSVDRLVDARETVSQSRELAARQLSAARHAHLENNTGLFSAKLKALTTLLPRLSRDRLLRMDPELLGRLIADIDGVAFRLVQLREYFPTADLQEMIGRRPALLLAEGFAQIPAARQALARTFPHADVDRMVTQQPLLLIEDVEAAIDELRRLMPNQDPLQTLQYNPHMLVSVMSNRKLSLW